MSNLNSGLTKDQIIKEYDRLHDQVFKMLADIDTKYLFRFISMQTELLKLYRILYSTDGTADTEKLESIRNLQYRTTEIEEDIQKIKTAMNTFKQL